MNKYKILISVLIFLFVNNLYATNEFIFSVSDQALVLNLKPEDTSLSLFQGSYKTIKDKIKYLNKTPSEPYDLHVVLSRGEYSHQSQALAHELNTNYREIIEPYIKNILRGYKHKMYFVNQEKAFVVARGNEFVIDLLTRGSERQIAAAKIFIHKYFRLPFKTQALSDVYNLMELGYNSAMVNSIKDYKKTELQAIEKLAHSLSLRVRIIKKHMIIGSGTTYNTLVDVYNQQKNIRSNKLKQLVYKINEQVKNKKVTFVTDYKVGALAYFTNTNPGRVSFVVPEIADLELYVHEVTHFRFLKFYVRYKKWVVKKSWAFPYQVYENTEMYWSLLNEINSWREGSRFVKPRSDKEILDILKKNYAKHASPKEYKAFFDFWTLDKLKNNSIPKLILKETKRLNTMSAEQLLEYGRRALETGAESEQRNYLSRLQRNISMTEKLKRNHMMLINLYLYKSVFVSSNKLDLAGEFNKSVQTLSYNRMPKQQGDEKAQEMTSRAHVYFENSSKPVKELMAEVFSDKYNSISEVMSAAQTKYKIIEIDVLKEFLELIDNQPEKSLSSRLMNELKKINDKSYQEYLKYYELNPSPDKLIRYLRFNQNMIFKEEQIVMGLKSILDVHTHATKSEHLMNAYLQGLLSYGLKDLRLIKNNSSVHNDELMREYQNRADQNISYFQSGFTRYVAKNLFELTEKSKIRLLVEVLKTFTTPKTLPKLKSFILLEIQLLSYSNEVPLWLKTFVEPADEGINLEWSKVIVDHILQTNVKNPELLLMVTNFYRLQLNTLFKNNIISLKVHSSFDEQVRLRLETNFKELSSFEKYWLNRVESDLWPLLIHSDKVVRKAALYSIVSNPAYLFMLESTIVKTLNDTNAPRLLKSQARRLIKFTRKGFFPSLDSYYFYKGFELNHKLPQITLRPNLKSKSCRLLFGI